MTLKFVVLAALVMALLTTGHTTPLALTALLTAGAHLYRWRPTAGIRWCAALALTTSVLAG